MSKEYEVSKSEAAFLEECRTRIKLPEDVEEEMERAASQRDYLKSCMLRTDAEAVTTNFVYRYLTANLADLFPREPNFSVVPADKIWGPQGIDPMLPVYADTAERFMNFHARVGHFKTSLREVAREALTVPIGILKLVWHEDFTRDPIGIRHYREADELSARYRRLYDAYKAKQFDKDSADYQRLIQLSDSLRPVALESLEEELDIANVPLNVVEFEDGTTLVEDPRLDEIKAVANAKLVPPDKLPIVPTFQRFSYDLVELEDFRWDWNVQRFSNYWACRWVGHRVRMTTEEIIEQFSLSAEEAEKLCKTSDNMDGENTQESREDLENNNSSNTIDVWEIQDAETRKVYTFTESFYRFLSIQEPTVTHERFFTLFPLQFGEVPGEFIGISNIDLQRPLQDEINERRTHEKHYLRSVLPTYGVAAGVFSTGDKAKLRNRIPFDMIELETTDNPNQQIFTFKADEVNQNWFDIGRPRMDLELVAGRPVAGIGGTSPGITATQTAFAGEQLGSQVSQNRAIFQDYMTDIGRAMLEILLQTTDEMEIRYVVGPGAAVPTGDRDAFFAQMNLTVSAYMDSEPNKDQMLARFEKFFQLAAAMGMMPNPMSVLPVLASEVLKLPLQASQMLIMPQPMQGGPGGPGLPASPQSPGPAPGVEGKPMQNTPSMASLPGRAQTVQNAASMAQG